MAQRGAAPVVALCFPPQWYYASVPADLLYTGSQLAALQAPGVVAPCVRVHDLSSGLQAHLFGARPGWRALRDAATYADAAAYQAAHEDLFAAAAARGQQHQVELSPYRLRFPDIDEGHIPQALRVGLDVGRNPALPYLRDHAVPALLRDDPLLIGVALGHPDQLVQIPVLGRLLRQAGFRGFLVLYGSHEDVVTPEDLVADLISEGGEEQEPHLLFTDYDGVVIGEAEEPLAALYAALCGARPLRSVPGLLAPRHGVTATTGAPRGGATDLSRLAPLRAELCDPTIYPFPAPVLDLRLSRSCAYGRCAFCAITNHQAGYRARPTEHALDDLRAAHAALGSRFFFFRDDLLTPAQLDRLGQLLPALPFAPRWAARARFESGLTRDVLERAYQGGLRELWLGLEAATPRVRSLMAKGVGQRVVERVLEDADEVGVRVRALCMIGYPGETEAEARETLAFLEQHLFRIAHAALTPFQLMRSAPLYQQVERLGLSLLPDAAPPRERLRYAARVQGPGLLDEARVQGLLQEGSSRLSGWLRGSWEGPTLMHALLRAVAEEEG